MNKLSWLSAILIASLGCANTTSDVTKVPIPKSMDDNSTVLFVVYDDSGSMGDKVANTAGLPEAKYAIADRALITIGKRLDNYLAASSNRTIAIGVILLHNGTQYLDAFNVLKSGVADYLTLWTNAKPGPFGGTPLGNAMTLASDNMIGINGVINKHILVLTDGASNSGPSPQEVFPTIKQAFKGHGVDVGIHLVAFDVNEGVFANLKSMGATVLGASNEAELNKQFDVILSEKILLEKAE